MIAKTFENREYLRWHEAAEVLGMDSEGLRQALRSRLSPALGTKEGPWLPVILATRGEGFLAHLKCDSPDRQPLVQWNNEHTFRTRLEGQRVLGFSDGSELPLFGTSGRDYWDANRGYGSGYSRTFTAGGETLVLSPDSVRHACDYDGDLESVDVAPYDWCNDGFPTESFHVIEIPGSMFQKRPTNLFESAQFLRSDVMQLLEESVDKTDAVKIGSKKSKPAHSPSDDHAPDPREVTAYLNAIGALLHLMLAKTPSGKAQSVFASQNKIIEAMLAHHDGKYGISQRNLEKTFAAARRSLES
jgi:hypothetical protein